MNNYYQILGVKRDASSNDIKKAYRKLAHKLHPDKNDGDTFFEERFKEIQEAYQVLSNQSQKTQYDFNFDYFFKEQQKKSSQTYTRKEEPKYKSPNPEEVRREKERVEKERSINLKKNTKLPFEDKAWIFIGNWFIIPGAVGLWMFVKYRSQGYTNKSKSVCTLTLLSFLALFVLAIILILAKEAGDSLY